VSLAKLVKSKDYKVLGVDASTNSFAFCVLENKIPIQWGEIIFEGSNVYERILDAKRKLKSICRQIDYDFVAIEAAVSVRSVATGLKMAYIFGAIMGELLDDEINVIEIHPITWQSYIGNKNFTKLEKDQVKLEYPDRSDNWIKAKIREKRKQRTIEFVKGLGVYTDNDNVADAAAIAWYAVNETLGK
jgi:hypothetical protein